LRDLQVKNDLIIITYIDFSKDKYSKHFSASNFIQKLLNGDKHERRWLMNAYIDLEMRL